MDPLFPCTTVEVPDAAIEIDRDNAHGQSRNGGLHTSSCCSSSYFFANSPISDPGLSTIYSTVSVISSWNPVAKVKGHSMKNSKREFGGK